MALTSAQAKQLLESNPSAYATKEALLGLIGQLSVETSGNITLLYSGSVGINISSVDVITNMVEHGEDIRVIDKTEAAKFLNLTNNPILVATLEDVFGDSPFDHGTQANDFLYNAKSGDGAWATASKNFVEATTGDVHTLTPFADASRVYAQTELPALLNNANVTHIDGISKDYLLRLQSDALTQGLSETQALEKVRATVAVASLDHAAKLHIAVDAQGNILRDATNGLEAIGTRAFFDGTSVMGVDLPAGTAAKGMPELIGNLPETHIDSLRQGWQGLEQLKQYAQLDNAGHALNKLGILGDAIGLMLVAHDANAAYAAGDAAGAQTILSNWAVELSGGLAGGLAAAQLAGSALAPLYLTGPAGALIAGGLTLLAGLAGGILGGQGALEFKNLLIATLQSLFNQAEVTTSPLILDLDGDGVETISKSAGIHFDHDGNRFAETTGWAGKDDGLLVWDRNGNGKIDSGNELFGNQTLLASGNNASNGFTALKELDSNNDGKISASDAAFTNLRVWKDGDSDAQVSEGELVTLDAAGVQSLGVTYTSQSQTDAQGNQHRQTGQYTGADGSNRILTDVWFSTDLARTIDQDIIEVNSKIAALPNLSGFGNVHSLHPAMARDISGNLQTLVQNFLNAANSNARQTLFQEIMFAWTGNSQYAADSRGGGMDDGRTLYTLESFLGENFVQGANGSTPGSNAAALLTSAYNQLSQTFYAQLMAQTHFKNLYDNIGLTWNDATSSFEIDVSAVVNALQTKYNADPVNGLAWMNEFGQGLQRSGEFGAQVLTALVQQGSSAGEGFSLHLSRLGWAQSFGSAIENTLHGVNDRSNYLSGLDGNDQLYGKNLDDILAGGAGTDTLDGYTGSDTLEGGSGDDILNGGTGSDIYIYKLGDGVDTINDYDTDVNNDKLEFGAGIDANAIQLSRSDNDFTLGISAADSVTIQGYFKPSSYGPRYRIETITFADGTNWDVATVMSKATYNGTAGADNMMGIGDYGNRINGLAGNDTITGGDKDDVLTGGEGSDTLNAGNGNDILSGEAGNDSLSGGYGNDVFKLISPDQGADTISDFTSGVDAIYIVGSNFGLSVGSGITLVSGSTTPAPSGVGPQFLYNTSSGALYFDQDGSETTYSPIQIVTLTGQKTLVASDLVVVA